MYSSMLTSGCCLQLYVDLRLLCTALCWPETAVYSSMLTSDYCLQLYVDFRLLCTALCWPETAMYALCWLQTAMCRSMLTLDCCYGCCDVIQLYVGCVVGQFPRRSDWHGHWESCASLHWPFKHHYRHGTILTYLLTYLLVIPLSQRFNVLFQLNVSLFVNVLRLSVTLPFLSSVSSLQNSFLHAKCSLQSLTIWRTLNTPAPSSFLALQKM